MTTAEQLLTQNGTCWDLGQLDKPSLAWLRREVKAGRLAKHRVRWPYITFGICTKTLWMKTK